MHEINFTDPKNFEAELFYRNDENEIIVSFLIRVRVCYEIAVYKLIFR